MDYAKEALRLHGEWKGKIEVKATVPVATKDDLSLAYTPGVAQPCLEIQKDISKSYELTRRHNLCAVITDGSAVLGLGDIGPEAGMPVMEGKCVLFKAFGDVDAFPICVKTKDVDEFVETVYNISGSFGGINLEDIAAPRCFEIERKLKEKCDIPIFHDDQHGTAVITLAGLQNALKVVGKKKEDVKIVTSGAGAAAIAIVKLLLSSGFRNVIMCDRKGAIYAGRDGLNWIKEEMAQITNLQNFIPDFPFRSKDNARILTRRRLDFFHIQFLQHLLTAGSLLALRHIGTETANKFFQLFLLLFCLSLLVLLLAQC